MTFNQTAGPSTRRTAFVLIVAGTVLGIAGTDLVLPAVPTLPGALGGTAEMAQYVLAAYVVGTCVGLLSFGELGTRFDRRWLLAVSLSLFASASLAAAFAPSLGWLIGIRFWQGAFAAAPAVFAPGLIRSLYHDDEAVVALARLGSTEALAPALAPIAGAYLLGIGGWRASFLVIATLSLAMALAMVMLGDLLRTERATDRGQAGYGHLLRDRVFLRYSVSQAFSLGSLLVFVFGAPAVFTGPLGLSLSAFIVLQVTGVATFIVGASLSGPASARLGAERLITAGTAALALGQSAILAYALSGGREPIVIIGCLIVVNFGFGLRGPVGFHRAVVAAKGDDGRGAALVVLGLLVTSGLGTAAAAPFIAIGLAPLAAIATAIAFAALLMLAVLPTLPATI